MIKRAKWMLAVATAVVLGGCTVDSNSQGGPASPRERVRPESVVATVDGVPISLRQILAEAKGADLEPALGRIIDRELLLGAARGLGLERDPVICDAMVRLMRERGLGREPAEPRDALVERARELGLDRDARIEKAMVALLFDRKASAGRASEEAIRAEYERRRHELDTAATVRLSDIVLKPSPDKGGQAEALAARIRAKSASSPESFAALAREHSVASSAAVGGDLGLVSETGKAALDPAVLAAAFTVKPNTPSEIVRGRDGLHILWVKQRRPAVQRSLEDVRAYLARDLESRESDRLRRNYLSELRSKARIEIQRERLTVVALAEVAR